MKAYFFVLFAFFSVDAMENSTLIRRGSSVISPASSRSSVDSISPVSSKENLNEISYEDILELLKPEENRCVNGIGNFIAGRLMRLSNENVLQLASSASLKRNSNSRCPFAGKAIQLCEEINRRHESALNPTTFNYDFLCEKGKEFIIEFKDEKNKNLLHRAIENKNIHLIRFLLQKKPSLLKEKDTAGSLPLDYAHDDYILEVVAPFGIKTEDIALEGSPKSQTLLNVEKNLA